MVGLGHEFPVCRGRSAPHAAQQDQPGAVRARMRHEGGRRAFGAGTAASTLDFEVQDDQIGMMPPGEFQPPPGTVGGENPQAAAFQGRLLDFASLLRSVDDQHALPAVQRKTLHGFLGPDVLVRPRPLKPYRFRAVWSGGERIAIGAACVNAGGARGQGPGTRDQEGPIGRIAGVKTVEIVVRRLPAGT